MGVENKIYAVGETVFDIVIGKEDVISGKAGGSVLNAVVSLSRLGLKTELLSEIGKDAVGGLIRNFLKDNDVSTRNCYFFNSGKTALALAFLNTSFDAEYTFYKQFPKKRFKVKTPAFKAGDSLLFGSSFALCPDVHKPLLNIIDKARDKQVLIMYDPNYRKPEIISLAEVRSMFYENISRADIIRGSYDDFNSLLNTKNAETTFKEIRKYSDAILVYSNGGSPGVLMDDRRKITFNPHPCTVLSTIGAGDNLNAGILAGLAKLNYKRHDLHTIKNDSWEVILDIGLTLAALVCASNENYISEDIARKLSVNSQSD